MEVIVKAVNENMTAIIQKAIDDCFLSGGGRVVLENGLYEIGSIRLRSNCTLYMKNGAVLKGVREIAAYDILTNDWVEPIDEQYKTDVLWTPPHVRTTYDHMTKAASRWNNALIRILEAHDVAIIAEKGAVIDGSDPYDAVGEEHYRGPHGIAYHHSKNIRLEGYVIRNTGNWAHIGYKSQNITYKNIVVQGGHDGIHNSSCDDYTIEDCEFYTGDDCVAGFDNYNVTVRNCILNSACSGMRFGGADILVENCRFYGPAQYVFRGAMPLADKIAGKPSPRVNGGKMLALFTYYSDFSLNVRRLPKNIIIRNCTVENCARFLHFDFTGTHTWQKNKPLVEITFDTIQASGISLPFNAYGSAETPLTLRVKNCDIRFSAETDCAIRSGNFTLIDVENTRFENVTDTLVKGYGGEGEIRMEKVNGVKRLLHKVDEKFISDNI
jgi:hypothetical protein